VLEYAVSVVFGEERLHVIVVAIVVRYISLS
jgi:hypothetical protein